MSQQNPTIIVGHLDDSELTKSIDKLVAEVAKKTSGMAEDFTQAIDKMKFAMKDFAITQKVSVDLMKEAWRDMSKSFDAMVAAQSASTGGGKGSGKGKVYAPDTVGALEQEIALEKEKRREMLLGSVELDKQNMLLEKRKKLLSEETSSPYKKIERSFTKEFGAANTMSTKTLQQAEDKLKRLINLQNKFKGTGLIDETKMNRLQKAIDSVTDKITKLRNAKPKSLDDVLGMDAKSIDQIAAKMRALKTVQIDPNNTQEVNRLGKAYADLKRQQAKMLGQNIQLTHSNNYLAQSFGYIRNRIVYALTLGALTNFVKQLYEIRGQYELLERSLGVLVGSFEKGTQIFNELNEMAIKSPFTLIELGTAAKQLTAYNFAASEVVDTTRRLADISAALGVPMERLTYNLGQIKAQGVLNARDARDFANAGLAIVPMLAKMYTEQKTFGDEMITTAQVYDMMSKKMVTYSDVLKVLYKVTDEGGKFFDFQAKQADTLRVQMANLTLAYNNMLNEIGSENQGVLSGMVSGLKTLLKHWRDIQRVLLTLITTFGVYKAVSMLAVGAQTISAWISLAKSIKSAKDAMALFNLTTSANPLGLLASLLAAVIGYFVLFKNEVSEVSREVEMFGESASKTISKVNTLKKVIDGTDETSNTYKKTLSELSNIANEYGIELDAEKARRDEINNATERTIQLIKEESAERQRANQLTKAQENYDAQADSARQGLRDSLKTAMTGTDFGIFTTKANNEEIQQNADAIADIIGSVVESNIMLIAGKTGDEYEKGLDKMYSIIQDRMRAIGISESTISKQWLSSTLFSDTNLINEYINNIVRAKNEQDNYVEKIEKNYKVAKKATEATMTFTQKVDANARALRNNTNDAVSLYNRVYDIVKLAKENHVINFDLKLSAENPPKWMLDKDLPELQRLAERFTAIAQSGGHAEGYDRESTYERGLMYASAARMKQEEEERKARNKDKDTRTKKSDEIAKAIKNEISLVKQLQSAYDTLTKKGDSHANAIAKVQDLYGKTIDLLNKDMDKFGLPRLDLSIIKGNNHNEVLAFFERLRDVLESKGLSNLERMEAVEGVVKEFRLKADTYNLDMITKGLNNELGKLKDEYELAVELDANPELGGMFLDMFGIDPSDFSHSIDDYMFKVQSEFEKARRELGYGVTIDVFKANDEEWKKWGEWVGLSGEALDNFKARFVSAQGVAKKWATDIVNNTKKLEYELAELNDKIAIKEKEQALLHERIEKEKNETTKHYLELTYQSNEKSIDELRAQALSLMPEYARVFNSIAEHSAGVSRRLQRDLMRVFDEAKYDSANKKWTLTGSDGKQTILNDTQYRKEREKLTKEMRKSQAPFKKIKEAFKPSDKNGVVDYAKGIELVSAEVQKLASVASEVGNLAQIFGADEQTVEIINDVATSLNGVATAGEGISKIASGDYIGGAASVLSGITSIIGAWSDNYDNKINREIEKSELAVKRLELAYVDLQRAVDKAYGTSVIGAKTAAAAAKKLELQELERQLRLEQSRDSKHKDDSRIVELQKQIKELKYEIQDMYTEVVNDLMGTDVASFAENLVSAMVDAFKQGEDAMKVFNDKFDELIDNMIMKSLTSRIVSSYIDKLWEEQEQKIKLRSTKEANELTKAQTEYDKVKNMSEMEWLKYHYGTNNTMSMFARATEESGLDGKELGEYLKNLYEHRLDALEASVENANKSLNDATAWTDKDILDVVSGIENLKGGLYDNLYNAISQWYTFGEDSDKNLSNLQQGIQGITEDTAGALEAYMNGVSQQVYLHSDLLTQIRDAVVGMDIDVQTASLSQILLQLQSSYQVQMSIQGILEGVLNPSGRAFSVELIS